MILQIKYICFKTTSLSDILMVHYEQSLAIIQRVRVMVSMSVAGWMVDGQAGGAGASVL